MLGSMQALKQAEINVKKKVSVEIAQYRWISSHANLAAYIIKNSHITPEPPQSAVQTGHIYAGSQQQTRAASQSGTARVQACCLQGFSTRKSYMKTQGMNILAIHPFDADEPDHLLTATGLIWTSNAAIKS